MITELPAVLGLFLDPKKKVSREVADDPKGHWGTDLPGTVLARDQVPRARFYVKARDLALGGWPGGPTYSWVLVPCDTREDAERSVEVCRGREEMTDIRIFTIATVEELAVIEKNLERIAREDRVKEGGSCIRGLAVAMSYDRDFTEMTHGLGSVFHHYTLMTKDRAPYWHGLD